MFILDNDNLYTRGCSVTEEPGCTDDTVGDSLYSAHPIFIIFDISQLTHNCNCKTALCNKNWETAGAEKKMKVSIAVSCLV